MFCFHTLSQPAFTCLFGGLSTKYPHAVDKEFLLMHSHHNLYFK